MTSLCIFGARYTWFLPTRAQSMLGASVIFGESLPYIVRVWDLPLSSGAILFLSLLAILFIGLLLFHIRLFIVLALCSKQEWPVYSSLIFSPSTAPYLLLHRSIFISSEFLLSFAIFCCLYISSGFLRSQWSEYTPPYINLQWDRSYFFQRWQLIFLGAHLWSSVGPFELISLFMVSWMWKGSLFIFLWVISQIYAWTDILSRRSPLYV